MSNRERRRYSGVRTGPTVYGGNNTGVAPLPPVKRSQSGSSHRVSSTVLESNLSAFASTGKPVAAVTMDVKLSSQDAIRRMCLV